MTVGEVVLVPSHLFDCMSVVSHDLFALEVEIHLSNNLGGWLDAFLTNVNIVYLHFCHNPFLVWQLTKLGCY